MTILDYETAIRSYRELRENNVSQNDAIKRLFEKGTGRMELVKAVEVVDGISAAESRKYVTKALAK